MRPVGNSSQNSMQETQFKSRVHAPYLTRISRVWKGRLNQGRKRRYQVTLREQMPTKAISGLFKSKREEYANTRRVIAFPFGLALGTIFSLTYIYKMNKMDDRTKFTLSCIISLSAGLGFALSRQIRCMVVLIIPVFGGKKGRMLIAAYAMSLVIAGPISNIIRNFSNMLTGIGCMTKLQYNLTLEKFQLRFEPIWRMTEQLELIGERSKAETSEAEKEWAPIKAEVEDQSNVTGQIKRTVIVDKEVRNRESRKNQMEKELDKINGDAFGGEIDRNYSAKNGWRCEDIYNRAMDECVKALDRANQQCRKMFWLIRGIVCYGFTLVENCNQLSKRKAFQKCTSEKGRTENFGEAYETGDQATNEFKKEFVYSLSAKVIPSSQEVDELTPVEMMQQLRHEFNLKKKLLAFILSMVNRIISFMFLLVVLAARSYVNLYLTNIQFDNIYITSYFRRIDARRMEDGKLSLLPFRKSEEQELCDPRRLKLTRVEKKAVRKAILPFVLQFFAIGLVYSFDFLLWNILDLVRRHGRIDYHQKGIHIVKLMVFGNGFMSELVRSIIKDVSVHQTLNNPLTNSACLPNPNKLSQTSIITVGVLYLTILFMAFLEIYTVRLKHKICGFFFPKREKRRVLYLYNERLKMRKNFLQKTIRKICRMANRTPPSGDDFLVSVERRCPLLGKLLNFLKIWKRKCILCEEKETKKFHKCSKNECQAVYCPACWNDVQHECFACRPNISDDSDLTDDCLDSN